MAALFASVVAFALLVAGVPAAGAAPEAVATGIATFDAVPAAAQVAAARALGLAVQPMQELPLAIVRGPAHAIAALVGAGIARDVYPDERIELLDVRSSDAMGAAGPRQAGLDGDGVTVAVVDSGCDGTHPDLAGRIDHNVKLVSGEYLNLPPTAATTLVLPVDEGPYRNTDLGSGHGTHVAGIIAADGTGDPAHLGVAPGARLVCYGIGEALFTTAVVTAYDHLLRQANLWGVDVVNNSWGNAFAQFDPRHPVNVATKAVSDRGVAVVFAAGNAGGDDGEMSLNLFALAPWVVSVAAAGTDRERGTFSSNGLRHDNAQAVPIGPGGHTVFEGDRLGIYHPDVTAPGVEVSSTCASTGLLIGPCLPGENATASGTSMASPHVAGAAAVLLQANPALTPAQVQQALQATAAALEPGFWQVGYGFVDLAKAVDLVRAPGGLSDAGAAIAQAQAEADARARAEAGPAVARSDFWTYPAPTVTVRGVPDHQTFETAVPATADAVEVTLAYPSLGTQGVNGADYSVTVRDASGTVVGTTTANPSAGTSSVLVDLATRPVAFGAFTFEVRGELAVSDPDTVDSESVLGRTVTLQVAQLVSRP